MISTIVNNVNCGADELMGTGLNNCSFDFNRAVTLEFSKRGYKYDDATGDTLAGIREAQQKGDVIILSGVVGVAFNTADDNMTTRQGSGINKLAGKNPIDVSFTFDNGIYFAKASQKLTSFGQYNLAIYDSEGNKLFADTKAGEYKGFACYQVNSSPYTPADGSEASMFTMTTQLNREEWDNRMSWITSDNLDYTAETDLDGYNDLSIEIVSATDATSAFTFDVSSKADNKKVAVSGLSADDFVLSIDGVSDTIVTITADASVQGRYNGVATSTFASPNVVTLKTYDATLSADVIDVEGVLYRSNTAEYTVTA